MTNNNDIEIDPDATYSFILAEKTTPDFKITKTISEWLVSNLTSLTDDNDKTIFSKVNTGFNENSLKTFSGHPTCDVYINNLGYSPDFDYDPPKMVNSIVLFYFKGANNKAYMKACELHDYLMQEFITNESFQTLSGVVRDTFITNSELMMQPINKKWGVMGAFELSHRIIY